MSHLSRVREVIERTHISEPMPCSEAEVIALEQGIGGRLPEAYKEFLLWMGGGAGRFLQGSFCFYEDLLMLQDEARAILDSSECAATLPPDAFVFWLHQGYEFLFFNTAQGDDPPVHYFNEAEGMQRFAWSRYSTFSDFLLREAAGHAQIEEIIFGAPNGVRQLVPQDIVVHPRAFDAELKNVEQMWQEVRKPQLAAALRTKDVRIKLVSQQLPCIVCQLALHRIQAAYPRLTLEIAIAGDAV